MRKFAAILLVTTSQIACASSASSRSPGSVPRSQPPAQEEQRCRIGPLPTGNEHEKPVILAVASKVDQYLLELPYDTGWRFDCQAPERVNDHAERVLAGAWPGGGGWEVSINLVDALAYESANGPEDYLRRIASDMSKLTTLGDFAVTQQSQVVNKKGVPVLVVHFHGTKRSGETTDAWSYWTFRRRADGKVLDLHLTVSSAAEHDLLEALAFRILTGFSVFKPE